MARAYGTLHQRHTQHTMRSVWMVLLFGSRFFYGAHGHAMRLMDFLQSHGEGYCITNRPQPLGVASDAAPNRTRLEQPAVCCIHWGAATMARAPEGAQWAVGLSCHHWCGQCHRPAPRTSTATRVCAPYTQLVRGPPSPSASNAPVAQQNGNRPLMPLTALQCRSATAKDGPHKGRTDDPYRGREAAARQGFEESIRAVTLATLPEPHILCGSTAAPPSDQGGRWSTALRKASLVPSYF